MNPILSFIENSKLIEREVETRKLDEHMKFMLAMEAMKTEVQRNSLGFAAKVIASAIDDQHIVGKLSGSLEVNLDTCDDALSIEHYQMGDELNSDLFGRNARYSQVVDGGDTLTYHAKVVGCTGNHWIIQDVDDGLVHKVKLNALRFEDLDGDTND